MAIAVSFHIPEKWKTPEGQDRLIHWVALVIIACTTLAIVFVLYIRIYRVVIAPDPINTTQLLASQRKINRSVLDGILRFDEKKHEKLPQDIGSDPFSP